MASLPDRPHPLARAPIVERANRFLASAWKRGWLPTPSLDAEDLWAAAAKPLGDRAGDGETGGRNAADIADFRERLARLTQSLQAEADLNPLGRTMAWGQLVRVIRNRLRLGALWNDRPELLETPLAPPIVVIGHMRSGTTRIHKLLAADPAHSHTRYCDAYHPVPALPGVNRVKSAVDLAMLGVLNPWLQSIHPMAPAEVEEELAWISAALHHSIYESQWRIPAYSAWSEARDPVPIYREFVRILRTDAAHRDNADRPRVLKVPAFSEDLSVLLSLLPGARLVIAERGREDVLRSAVSLAANQMAIQSDSCDIASIEQLWQLKIDLREQRVDAALDGWDGPVARLQFDDLNRDWESEMRKAYAALGLELSDAALAAMRGVMAADCDGDHLAHAEQLKRFEAAGR